MAGRTHSHRRPRRRLAERTVRNQRRLASLRCSDCSAPGGRPGPRPTARSSPSPSRPLGALVAEPLYILADTAVVGNLGTPQLGGLALASSLLLIAFAVFIFLAYGTTSAVARLLGAGEDRQAAHQAVQSVWLAFVVGVVISVAMYAARTPLIELLGGEGEVAVNAEIYLRISLLGVPAMLIALAGVGYLRGLQDTRRPLYVAVGTALLNLVVELVLIYGFDQGIGASALATVVAQWVGAFAYVAWIARAVARHEVGLAPDWRVIRQLAGAGLDLLLRTSALRGGLTVTVAVAARLGDADLAAHEIAFQIWSVLALALDAVAIAAQAMIGHALGAGDAAEARRLGDRMIQWGWWGGVAFLALVLASIPVLPDVFSNDSAVTSLAAFLFVHVAVWQPVAGIVFAPRRHPDRRRRPALPGRFDGRGDGRADPRRVRSAVARSRDRLALGCVGCLDARPRRPLVGALPHRRLGHHRRHPLKRRRVVSAGGLAGEEFGDGAAVGLTLRGLHDLAREEPLHLLAITIVATREPRPFVGVGRDQLIDQRLELVALHRLEAVRSSDRLRVAAVGAPRPSRRAPAWPGWR